MKTIGLRQLSTPAVIAAGLFVSLSGVAMFFGIHHPLEEAHEWIGLVFAAAIALHVVNHWRGFRSYFSQPIALGILGAVALATSALLMASASEEGGHGMAKLIRGIEGATPAQLAPLLHQSQDQILAKVQAAGFRIESADRSIAEIAAANGSETKAVMRLLLD